MSNPQLELTRRTFLMYLVGSYLVAGVGCLGVGLVSNASWKQIVGGVLVSGLILFGLTLHDQQKKRERL